MGQSPSSPSPVYHERQSRQLCLLHSLNNLFQEKVFQKQDFDLICENLSPNAFINPHKSPIPGMGGYDVNILIAALESKGLSVLWFDKRKEVSELNLDRIFGFVLNVPVDGLLGRLNPLSYVSERKHWVAIKKINSVWLDLDSKLSQPRPIGDDAELLAFLRQKSRDAKCQILVILSAPTKAAADEVYGRAQ